MNLFRYVRADQPAGAVRQASGDAGAAFLAGGTNLVDLMRLNVARPAMLVDVNGLPMDKIEVAEGAVRIGALVRNSDLAYHEQIRTRFPVLSEALLSGASPQLRNMATVGGNLLQRTRCYYFRDTSAPCNKREPDSGCSALEGYNRIHAVLGASEKCIAVHPSDMCVALVALDAVVKTQGPKGERSIDINDFYLLPGDTPQRETVLEHGELITAVELPDRPFAAHSHYVKARDRASFEFALASAAAALEVRDGVIHSVRLALGGVATRPWRAAEAEKALVGRKAEGAAFRAAAGAALKDARPRKYNAYKIELARRVIVRALEAAAAKA